MELAPDLFEQIIGYRTIGFDGYRDEKRLVARAPLSFRSTLLRIHAQSVIGAPLATRVRELSSRGISIVHREPLRTGSAFAVQLPRRQADPVWALYIVTRSRAIPAAGYVIGGCYQRVIGVRRHDREVHTHAG
ncbi:MAG: hypothetical protein ACM359_06690 [Bacillota bacterium]